MTPKIYQVNSVVKTPLGTGTVDGMFLILDGRGNEVARGVGVRLPVNDVTKDHLNKSSCMTPCAHLNGVWVFSEEDLTP